MKQPFSVGDLVRVKRSGFTGKVTDIERRRFLRVGVVGTWWAVTLDGGAVYAADVLERYVPDTVKIQVSSREFDTIIAALRLYQKANARASTRHAVIDQPIANIANEHGPALTDPEIDKLIQRIN